VALFKTGVSILNETIRNSSMIITNISNSMQNAAQQAMSNYTACLSSGSSSSNGGLFSIFFSLFTSFVSPATCASKVTTQLIPAFINTTTTQIQNATQIFSQLLSPSSLNSSVHTLPQMAGLGANLTASFAAQIVDIGAQAMKCMAQGFSSAMTGFSG